MNEDKGAFMVRWCKLASLAYDIKYDKSMLEPFKNREREGMLNVISDYDLTEEDFQDFREDMNEVKLSSWWLGVEA